MICPTCGKELDEGTRFCPQCGTRLDAPASVAGTPAGTADVPSAEAEAHEPKKKFVPTNPLPAIVAACFAVTCFYLPFATYSLGEGIAYDIRMLDIYTGIEPLGLTIIEPHPMAALFIALPAAAVLVGLVGKGLWRSIILLVAGLALGALCIFAYNSFPLSEYLSPSIGLYGYIICAAIIVFST